MILVTLGTQKQQFTRLLDYIEESKISDEIIVQAGHTKYKSKKMKIFDFIDYDKMNDYIKKADIIITHGGTGSIIGPLKKGKKIIACARKNKYGEHVDDHQMEIVDLFDKEGYILKLDETVKLDILIKRIIKFKPQKFVSNTNNFIKKLENKINMVNNERNYSIVLVLLFIIFIFMAIGLLTIRKQKIFSPNENRNLNQINLEKINEFDNGNFQDSLESALSDQIMLSETLKIYGKKLSLFISNLSLNLLYDYDRYDIVPISDGLYKIKDTNYLVYGENRADSFINASSMRINDIIKVATKYPNIDVYAWRVRREMDFNGSEEYDNYMNRRFGELVTYSSFSKINSYEDYMKYFYKSDHHWNYVGQYEGYKEIANILGFGEDEYVKIINKDCFGDIQYYGSKARVIGNPSITDTFCAYKYDLPEYKLVVPNTNVNIEGSRYYYYARKIPVMSNIGHYHNFYGGDYGEMRYTFNNNISKENILIFVDSYSNPINELIASHYYKTYIIDLRNYKNLVGKDFILDEYMSDKKIDNIMFLGNINFFVMSEFNLEIGD